MQKEAGLIQTEIAILTLVHHKNIVELIDTFESKEVKEKKEIALCSVDLHRNGASEGRRTLRSDLRPLDFHRRRSLPHHLSAHRLPLLSAPHGNHPSRHQGGLCDRFSRAARKHSLQRLPLRYQNRRFRTQQTRFPRRKTRLSLRHAQLHRFPRFSFLI